jgi:hypothetical protein
MSKITQKQRVLDAIISHGSISTWYAFKNLGNTRLAATIHSLKKDGHVIESTKETSKNKFGDTVHYVRYIYVKKAD